VADLVFWTPQRLLVDIQYSNIALHQQHYINPTIYTLLN